MDKAFWQGIVAAEYAIPEDRTLAELTTPLMAALGSTDPQLRDGLAYPILERWINEGLYTPAQMRTIAAHLLQSLQVGVGQDEDDSVFLRAFAVLILSEIITRDNDQPFLEADEVRAILKQAVQYLLAEVDLRGYVKEKGWAHAVAHCADLLAALSRSRHLDATDIEWMLLAISDKVSAPSSRVFLFHEDERLAYAVLVALRRNLLNLPELNAWLDRLAHPERGVPWTDAFMNERDANARLNTLIFLRSVYFQLTLSQDPPAISLDVLHSILDALRAMDIGFYKLP